MNNVRTTDVVIIGGGVIGSAVAYFLASEPAFGGRIVVVERDSSYRGASSPLSVGGIRQQFSTPENIDMSLFGATFFRTAAQRLAVGDTPPELGFVEGGYLFLASADGIDILRRNHTVQIERGANIHLLERDALARRFAWLNTSDIVAASLGASGEGWLDPYALLMGLRAKAKSLGVTFIEDEVVAVERTGNTISAIELAATGRLVAGHVVNAAGIRAAEIAALAGIPDLPIAPRKRCVFMFHAAEAIGATPLVVDPSGVYFRPEGDGFICGVGPDPDPDCDDFTVDHSLFEEVIWPRLAHRVPAFEALKPGPAWAGHYAYNTVDQNAVLGAHPDLRNFFFTSGFSGHGLQQSPAVGRATAELITFGEYRSLDLSKFGFGRFALNAPVRELNVV